MMFFTACDDAKKTGADAAIKGAQTAYAAIADQANQYVPFDSAQGGICPQNLCGKIRAGDYNPALV